MVRRQITLSITADKEVLAYVYSQLNSRANLAMRKANDAVKNSSMNLIDIEDLRQKSRWMGVVANQLNPMGK